jgi:5,10-methylenetetrahydromethanopterin reductase
MLELAKLVDEAGADRLGISDVAMLRDTFLVQALCAQATNRVQIGSLVSNPYLRHPAAVATTLATLNEITQGRTFLGIGVGAGLSGLSIDQSRPARRGCEDDSDDGGV